MKKSIVLLVLLAAALVLWAQEKSAITVKSSTVTTGVVIISAETAGKPLELQCNQSMADCTVLKPGDYWMVRLPKNYGMYDCANVDLFPKSADPESSQKIGEYCLIQK
ncbi:MAG TPA: hypothetical protein VMT28_04205 [Terriglobales bacterium]|jgi:hypothetical protein|nr:hypothetical protein [Terriglobales bacterium]